jgi:hypothetical protein
MATTQADIFNATQLQQKAIVLASIYQHYGWRQQADGSWAQGADGREIPNYLDTLRITRKDIHRVQLMTSGVKSFVAFQQAQGNDSVFVNNLEEINLSPNKLRVIFGFALETATGAADTDTPDLLTFATPAEKEVLNGTFSLKANTLQIVKQSQIKSAFVNDDAVKNYFRLPEPLIWESGNSIEFQTDLAAGFAAAAHKFQRITAVTFELTK